MLSSSPVRTPKLQVTAEQPSTGECWTPPKEIPYVQGQRRSTKMVGEAKLHLKSNPITTRDTWRAETKPHVHQDPGTPHETNSGLPLNV